MNSCFKFVLEILRSCEYKKPWENHALLSKYDIRFHACMKTIECK